MSKVGKLETYGETEKEQPEKKGLFKRFFDNTIGKSIESKRQEDELRKEALAEARDELREIRKKQIIKEEMEKANKPKKNVLQTIADEMKIIPATDEKMDRLVGRHNTNVSSGTSGPNKVSSKLGFNERLGSPENMIGQPPYVRPEDYLTSKNFPKTKTDNIALKEGRFDKSIKRALGK